jgi:hypothetical protein
MFLFNIKYHAVTADLILMGGRIADIAVHPTNSSVWFVAVGSGGVWKTSNAGITWIPVFDDQAVYSIGDVTIDPNNPDVVWVGTGENVSGRHVAWGDGVYKSSDSGKTWTNMGLRDSEHIGNILIDPRDSNVVYVAAEGPLWNAGGDRGLYKTTDGGQTSPTSNSIHPTRTSSTLRLTSAGDISGDSWPGARMGEFTNHLMLAPPGPGRLWACLTVMLARSDWQSPRLIRRWFTPPSRRMKRTGVFTVRQTRAKAGPGKTRIFPTEPVLTTTRRSSHHRRLRTWFTRWMCSHM